VDSIALKRSKARILNKYRTIQAFEAQLDLKPVLALFTTLCLLEIYIGFDLSTGYISFTLATVLSFVLPLARVGGTIRDIFTAITYVKSDKSVAATKAAQ
jgi:hypothetical protein